MNKNLKNKIYNMHGESMRFMIGYPKDILTISNLIEILQSLRNNTELFRYIKAPLIATGNQGQSTKGDDTNE